MRNRNDRDFDDERNRGEFSGSPDFGGYYARDGGWSGGGRRDEYAREGGWSGGGDRDDYTRETNRNSGRDDYDRWGGRGERGDGYGGSAAAYGETRSTGGYRGRGPRNWRPSDERIRDLVNELLTDHDGIDATEVEVAVENGEVTLSGHVGSRWQKRLAEDIAASVRGVHDVHNRLRVADRETQIGKASE